MVNLLEVEEAVFAMTNDIRRQNGLPVLLKDEICRTRPGAIAPIC